MRSHAARAAYVGLAAASAWLLSSGATPLVLATFYDHARVLELVLLCLFTGAMALYPKLWFLGWGTISRYSQAGLAAFLALGAVSSALCGSLYAWMEWGLFLLLALSAVALRGYCQAFPELRRFGCVILAFGGVVLGVRALTDLAIWAFTDNQAGLDSSWAPFLGPRYFAKAATWAIPLLWLLPRLRPAGKWPLVLCFMISYGVWVVLMNSGSRGALLGLAATSVLALFFLGSAGRKFFVAQACLSAAALGTALFIDLRSSRHLIYSGLSGRGQLYGFAWDDITSSPFFGVGPGQFALYGLHPGALGAGPHSVLLQLAAEWGLLATALGAFVAVRWGMSIVRRIALGKVNEDTEYLIDVALVCAILSTSVHSLVANVANDPVSQVLFMWAVGLTGPHVVGGRLALAVSLKKALPLQVLTLAGVSCAVILLTAGLPCATHPEYRRLTYAFGGTEIVFPRLWSQGLIPLEQTCVPR